MPKFIKTFDIEPKIIKTFDLHIVPKKLQSSAKINKTFDVVKKETFDLVKFDLPTPSPMNHVQIISLLSSLYALFQLIPHAHCFSIKKLESTGYQDG